MPSKTSLSLNPPAYQFRPLREAIFIGILILIATTHANYFLYQKALEAQKGEINDGLMLLSKALVKFIEPSLHQSLTAREQQYTEAYREALVPLAKVLQGSKEIVNVYTMVRRDEDILFVLDPTPSGDIDHDGQEDKAFLMEKYESPPHELRQAFAAQQYTVTEHPYQDKWGEHFSSFTPLLDEQGNMYGMLGLDLSAEGYRKRLYPIQRHFVRTSAVSVFIAFIVACFIWFLRRFCQVVHQNRMQLINFLRKE
ncbi:chemotaxis protein [Paraneptunicella aestuarii]|uniref:chemotaxis protein n=1 Tax=Paraneptunicella aestuarii TaxID=2831148 RepID=UPI001E313523|nr:chemotaxis protein [Paraneptunicella aestuarii]UAA39172.1 chemotaxis protein [Paraneptunicella aestuarii]